jgi:hypothetical protein
MFDNFRRHLTAFATEVMTTTQKTLREQVLTNAEKYIQKNKDNPLFIGFGLLAAFGFGGALAYLLTRPAATVIKALPPVPEEEAADNPSQPAEAEAEAEVALDAAVPAANNPPHPAAVEAAVLAATTEVTATTPDKQAEAQQRRENKEEMAEAARKISTAEGYRSRYVPFEIVQKHIISHTAVMNTCIPYDYSSTLELDETKVEDELAKQQIELLSSFPVKWKDEGITWIFNFFPDINKKLLLLSEMLSARNNDKLRLGQSGGESKLGRFTWIAKGANKAPEAEGLELLWNTTKNTTEKVLLMFTVGLANEFANTLRKANLTIDEMTNPTQKQCLQIAIDAQAYSTKGEHKKFSKKQGEWQRRLIMANITAAWRELSQHLETSLPQSINEFTASQKQKSSNPTAEQILAVLTAAYLETLSPGSAIPSEVKNLVKQLCFYTLYNVNKDYLVKARTDDGFSDTASHRTGATSISYVRRYHPASAATSVNGSSPRAGHSKK